MKGLVNEAEAVLTRLDQTFEGKSAIIPVERKKDGSLSSRSSTLPQDELTIISNYVNNKIKSLGHRILSGDIEKSPYAYGESTGCDYCVYQSVCGFKKELAGYAFNRCYSMSAEEAIEKMRQEGDK